MSIVTMVAVLLRGKVMAMSLGPTGVGLSGIINQGVALESQVLALGLPTVVVKSVAGADVEARPKVESAIARLALALCVCLFRVSPRLLNPTSRLVLTRLCLSGCHAACG